MTSNIVSEQITATVAGSAGSATGSQVGNKVHNGYLEAIYVNVSFTQGTDSTNVTVRTATAPKQDILTLTDIDSANNGWYYPRVLLDGVDGADLTAVYQQFPISDKLEVDVTDGDAGTVEITALVSEL